MVSKLKSTAKRFGARYGNTLRKKVGLIEKTSRGKHKCKFCGKEDKVKRIAYGIWKCRSCEKKFIGRAYTPY